MSGFFESIRNYFDGKYHGRYLAIILRELASHEPQSFALIIRAIANRPDWNPNARKAWKSIADEIAAQTITPTCEFHLPAAPGHSSKVRRADLAFVDDRAPKLLVEIKAFDGGNPENAAQLDDYLRNAKRTPFIYLSRFRPEKDGQLKIARKQALSGMALYLSWEDVHQALVSSEGPLATLVREYLEDNGVGVWKEINWSAEQKTLQFLLAQMLDFPHRNRLGRTNTHARVADVPKLITWLLGNAEVLGEWVRASNEDIIPRRFSRRFYVKPVYSYSQLRKKLEAKDQAQIDALPYGLVKGGWVFFAATGSLRAGKMKTGDWLYLELGIGISLYLPDGNSRSKPRARPYVYSELYNNHVKSTYDEMFLTGNPTKQHVQGALRAVLKKSIAAASKQVSGPTASVLRKFQIPLVA